MAFYAPAWKVRRWDLRCHIIRLSVCLSVLNSIPLTYNVQYLKFGWWYSYHFGLLVHLKIDILALKPQCLKPPGHYLCTPEPDKPDRLNYVISIQKVSKAMRTPSQAVRKWQKIYLSPFIVPRLGLKVGWGQHLRLKDFARYWLVAAGGICILQTHV